eukprot:TRINITY_DN159_c0_g1_i1.p1 TRINITY_DN159_c0_g1~~TRINITY_DN159_c0_g1_i1.p1  ORF type:complete len:142 (-),score=42.41 TRINITY_DN159_c0_g1_i1:190-558(-)
MATASDANSSCSDYSGSPHHRFTKLNPYSTDPKVLSVYRNMSGPSPVLHVSNLPDSITSQVLTDTFAPFGTIVKIKLFTVNDKKQALIQYTTVKEAGEALVAMHNAQSDAKNIRVAFSKNQV